MSTTKYIPALRFKWLTPFYDFLINLTMPEKKFKESLIESCGILEGHKILDFGCGTATLSILIKKIHPEASVIGLDVDKEILNKAIRKIEEMKVDIRLFDYSGDKIPFTNESFDRVVSSLVFHHLDTNSKIAAFKELYRLLNRNGELHIADFGRSKSWLQRLLFNLIRGLDGYKSTNANAKGLLPELIVYAGFENVSIKRCYYTMFGEVQIISAYKN